MSLARNLTKHFDGDWNGRSGLVSPPGHSPNDRSLSIADHESDPEDVVLHSFAGDDVLALKRQWREQGLLPSRRHSDRVADPAAVAKAKIAKVEAQKREEIKQAKQRHTVIWLWDQTKPAAGTIIETYLPKRGIVMQPLTAILRFLPANDRYLYPAMVAPFGIPDEPEPGVLEMPRDRVRGVHLTYLAPDGNSKAPVDPPRKMLGKVSGHPIVLAPPNDGLGLLIAEGIETALSGHLDTGLGAWAAGAAGFMPTLADAVPDYIECVTVAVEADPAGRRGAEELIRRLAARGIETMKLEV
jgi:hypothetical protein